MDPKISSIVEEDGILRFQLQNTNVSFANAIRRTLLSDIPTLVMRDSPYEQTTIKITKNTTRLNNEIIRHRLSCVPIHHDTDFPIDKYSFVIDVENTGNNVITVTTGDIKVIDTDTGKEAPASISKQLFPLGDEKSNGSLSILGLYIEPKIAKVNKINVRTGAKVKAGQLIGAVGNTGFSRGAHLHWEKYASGRQLNPIAENQ